MTELKKLFLSAVSGDFRDERGILAIDLRRAGVIVEDQEHFRNRGGLLLQLLDDYIRECAAVVHLIGGKSGYVARPDEVAFILGRYPNFLMRFPQLTDLVSALSYTQWEAWLAIYHGKRLHVWLHQPASPLTFDAVQQRHLEFIQGRGQHWPTFQDREDLRTQVLIALHDILPHEPQRQPNNLPYRSLGTLFKGRDKFLEALRAKLIEGHSHAVGVLAAQTIHGLGGVGKTRVAVEFAWRHAGDFSALLFVTADSPENLQRNLAGLVGPLVLDLQDAQQISDQNAQMAAALQWLQSHERWFLILDNVDDEATAKEVQRLVAQLTQGRILITSRLSKWSKGVDTLALDVLAEQDACDFLLERTAGERQLQADDTDRGRAIARDLDGLALALEQAAAYIAELGLSLAAYQQRWQSQRDQVLKWYDERVMEYPRSLAVTWETSFAQLTPGAQALLEHLCWLAPEPIPQFLFDDQGPGRIDPADDDISALWQSLLQEDVFAAMGNLARYSLLKREQTDAVPTLLVHRLVQEITRRRLEPHRQTERLADTLRVLDFAWPGSAQDVRTWPRWNLLAPHYVAACSSADALGLTDPTARLLNNAATLYITKSLLGEAEPLMRRALAIDEAAYGPEHPTVATGLNNLAQLLKATNRLDEAEPLMRRALAIDEAAYGPDHPDVARDLNNLALLLQATNRLGEAEPLMRRALEIDEAAYGPEHPAVATYLNNLAQLLQDTNRLDEAEPLMRRALAIDEAAYGPEHPDVATDLNNLAQLLQDTNRLDEAEPLMRRALQIFRDSLGDDHPNTKTVQENYELLLDEMKE